MRMRALLAALLFGTVLFAGAPGPLVVRVAHACSCADPTERLAESVGYADVVFVGTLTEVRRPEVMLSSVDESRFVFDVEAVFKGDGVHARQSIVSASDGASCGLELEVGTRALVFGRSESSGDVTADDGEFVSGLCDSVSRPTAAVVEQLGAGGAPLPGSSPIGADEGVASTLVRTWPWIVATLAAAAVIGVWLLARRRAGRVP